MQCVSANKSKRRFQHNVTRLGRHFGRVQALHCHVAQLQRPAKAAREDERLARHVQAGQVIARVRLRVPAAIRTQRVSMQRVVLDQHATCCKEGGSACAPLGFCGGDHLAEGAPRLQAAHDVAERAAERARDAAHRVARSQHAAERGMHRQARADSALGAETPRRRRQRGVLRRRRRDRLLVRQRHGGAEGQRAQVQRRRVTAVVQGRVSGC